MSDFSLEHDLNRYAGHHRVADTILRHVAESQLEVAGFVVALILLGLILRRRRLFLAGVAALVAAGIAVVGNVAVAHLWYRPRPFVAHPHVVHLIVHHPADASFPSDHSAALAAISVALLYFFRRLGIAAILFTLLVGFARVYVGEHYPGDVLGGYAIGVLAALLVLAGLRSRLVADRIVPRLSFLTP